MAYSVIDVHTWSQKYIFQLKLIKCSECRLTTNTLHIFYVLHILPVRASLITVDTWLLERDIHKQICPTYNTIVNPILPCFNRVLKDFIKVL